MKRLLKVFLWIIFFPFMLTYWGWKKKKKSVMALGAVLSFLFIIISWAGQGVDPEAVNANIDRSIAQSGEQTTSEKTEVEKETEEVATFESTIAFVSEPSTEIVSSINPMFEGFKLIEVDGGDLSGYRAPNVVVNIGFGDREYWAFTNEFGQLVKIVAAQIILQDDDKEQVTSEGRYYQDEAKVPGTGENNNVEAHVIADSLGGVANAYNITPQNSVLNQHGDQAYMEKSIREAGGCNNFVAIISYPDHITHVPSHYSFTYTLMGNAINENFDNVNPDVLNLASNVTATTENGVPNKGVSDYEGVAILELNKSAEFIVIANSSNQAVNLAGWKIRSVKGDQNFMFPDYVLEANASVKVGDSKSNNDIDLHWLVGRGVWNNSESDPAELYDNFGALVDQLGK